MMINILVSISDQVSLFQPLSRIIRTASFPPRFHHYLRSLGPLISLLCFLLAFSFGFSLFVPHLALETFDNSMYLQLLSSNFVEFALCFSFVICLLMGYGFSTFALKHAFSSFYNCFDGFQIYLYSLINPKCNKENILQQILISKLCHALPLLYKWWE